MSKLNDTNAVVTYMVDDTEIKLTPTIVKEYIVGDANANITDQEYKMFVELCKVRKLNPFLKEAYLIKYGNAKATIVVGKDAILKRAISHKEYNGREQGIIILKENGDIEERKGTFKLPKEQLVGGWARVHRKDIEYPTYVSVSLDEAAQKKSNGEYNQQWATKGATMVEKVALVRALRETFIEDLGGMLDNDEVWDTQPVAPMARENKETIVEQSEPLVFDTTINQPQESKTVDFAAI